MNRHRILKAGFTLIELVVIIVILGVLAAVLVPRSNNDAMMLSAQAAQIAADIRYAQALAMTRGGRHWILFSTSPNYDSYRFNNVSGVVADPGGQGTNPVSLNAFKTGFDFTLTNLPNSLITFNGMGVPYIDSGAITPLSVNADLVMGKGAAGQTVRIHPETGMVRVCAVPPTGC